VNGDSRRIEAVELRSPEAVELANTAVRALTAEQALSGAVDERDYWKTRAKMAEAHVKQLEVCAQDDVQAVGGLYELRIKKIEAELETTRAERDEARAYAASLTGAVKGAVDFDDAMRRIRETPPASSAANAAAIARAVAALGAGRSDAAELPQQDPQLPQ
jgi:hypothetical protein